MSATTFEAVKPLDRVWCIRRGWGVVNHVNFSLRYPVIVVFPDLENPRRRNEYTVDGKEYDKDNSQVLFWDEIRFEVPAQPVRMKLIQLIHGVAVPDISFIPIDGQQVYTPSITNPALFDTLRFNRYGCKKSECALNNYMCYPYTKEGAIAAMLHTKAMLGIAGDE